MNLFERLSSWIYGTSSSLPSMRLGPDGCKNPIMLQFFTWESHRHGNMSWWRHFEDQLPTIAEMGFTQVWLPPPNKAATRAGQGYDAYDLWDLGEFEQKGGVSTRWGTREEFLSACRLAKRLNVDIIIDAVLNHKLGADRLETFSVVPVNPDNRLHELGPAKEIEGWTAFDFKGRNGTYSTFRWNHEHFTGLDWDHRSKSNGIFRIVSKHRQGWSPRVDKEFGNYDYLLGCDIDHNHPDVQKDLLEWGTWILKTTDAVGFRLDAIKHIDRRFLRTFLSKARSEHNQRLFVVSEYWSSEYAFSGLVSEAFNVFVFKILMHITALQSLTAFFDVPLHENLHRASAEPNYDLRYILKNTLLEKRPNDAVTFVDNHDTGIGRTLESWVGDNFKAQAYAIILLREGGYPCVFYGDLYEDSETYNRETSLCIRSLIYVRRTYAFGRMRDFLASSDCIGFTRDGISRYTGCAVVIRRSDTTPRKHVRMSLGKARGGSAFKSLYSGGTELRLDANGWGEFTTHRRLDIWIPKDEI